MAQHGAVEHSRAQHGAAWHSMAEHAAWQSMAQRSTAWHSRPQHGAAWHSGAQHGAAGAHRQGFIGVVEIGQVGNPGAVPGHLVAVQQEAPKQQKHHDGQTAQQIGHPN